MCTLEAFKILNFMRFEFPALNISNFLPLNIDYINFFCQIPKWICGLGVRTPDFGAEGPGFKSQMSHFIFPFSCIKVNIFILHLAKLCIIKCLKVARSAILSKILGFCKIQIFGSSVELYVATYFKNDFSQMLILSCGTFLSSIFVIQWVLKNFQNP